LPPSSHCATPSRTWSVTASRWRRGFTHLIPFAAGHELLRQRRSELELIRMTPDVLYNGMIGMRRASITPRISSLDPEVEAACEEVQFGSTKPFVACNGLHPEQPENLHGRLTVASYE
jgi:hypothetical protein